MAAQAACAGNGMLNAPVDAEMTLDRIRAPVGATVRVTLRVVPYADAPKLTFIVKSDGCAKQVEAASPAVVHNAKNGAPIVVTATFAITQAKQCMIVGEVMTVSEPTIRMASIFHVMLNPEPPPPDKGKLRLNPEGGMVIEYDSGANPAPSPK